MTYDEWKTTPPDDLDDRPDDEDDQSDEDEADDDDDYCQSTSRSLWT